MDAGCARESEKVRETAQCSETWAYSVGQLAGCGTPKGERVADLGYDLPVNFLPYPVPYRVPVPVGVPNLASNWPIIMAAIFLCIQVVHSTKVT